MTYSNTYNSFTLANSESYAWATENWDASAFANMSLQECAEESRKEARVQLALAIENVQASFLQSEEENDEGEALIRNRTLSEIVEELNEDLPFLESYLYRWMVEAGLPQDDPDDPTEGGSEPLPQAPTAKYLITHEMMGDWSDPATITEIASDVANWRDENVEYRVEGDYENVYIYAFDSNPDSNSREWREWLYLGFGEYRLKIGELYQDEEEGDDEPDPQPIGVEVALRLLEEGFITETDGIYINRANGHAGNYDISKDVEDRHLYEVVWVQGGNGSYEAMTKEAVIALIREEAERGAEFYWQVMENNEWERTHAPQVDTETLLPPSEKHYQLFTGEVYTNAGLNILRNAKVKGTWVYRVYESPNWTFGEEYYPIGRVILYPTNLAKALKAVVGTKALEVLANVEKAVGAFPKDLQNQWREYQRVRAAVRVAIADTVASWRTGEWTDKEDDLIDMIDNIFYHNL